MRAGQRRNSFWHYLVREPKTAWLRRGRVEHFLPVGVPRNPIGSQRVTYSALSVNGTRGVPLWRSTLFGSVYEFLLVGFTLWLIYGVVIARINPSNADKIIKATGLYFPLRIPRWWRRKN